MVREQKSSAGTPPAHHWVDGYLEHVLIEKGLSENSLSGYSPTSPPCSHFLMKNPSALKT